MTQNIDPLQILRSSTGGSSTRPTSETLVSALLRLEKKAKRERLTYPFEGLLGTWTLIFITGTQKARKQAGIALGKGRYIPQWLDINITYKATKQSDALAEWQLGRTTNSVSLGLIQLTVSGPIKFQSQKRLLAFDFTHISLQLGSWTVYQGAMRGGDKTDATFEETAISQLPFFSYFHVEEKLIAARGRGGGLAIWQRKSDVDA